MSEVTIDVVYLPTRSWRTLWLWKRSTSLRFAKETTRAEARNVVITTIGPSIEAGRCGARITGDGWVEHIVPDGWTVEWGAS